jgi:hypothetical protein
MFAAKSPSHIGSAGEISDPENLELIILTYRMKE